MHLRPLVVALFLRGFSVWRKIVLTFGWGHFGLTLDSRHEDGLSELAVDPLLLIDCFLIATY